MVIDLNFITGEFKILNARQLTPEAIMQIIAEYHRVTITDLVSTPLNRQTIYTDARKYITWYLKELINLSDDDIGKLLNYTITENPKESGHIQRRYLQVNKNLTTLKGLLEVKDPECTRRINNLNRLFNIQQ